MYKILNVKQKYVNGRTSGDIPHPRGVKKCIVGNFWTLTVDFLYYFWRRMENIATEGDVF